MEHSFSSFVKNEGLPETVGLFRRWTDRSQQSDASMGRFVGRDATQISKWLSGARAIPRNVSRYLRANITANEYLLWETAHIIEHERSLWVPKRRSSTKYANHCVPIMGAAIEAVHTRRAHFDLRSELEYLEDCYLAGGKILARVAAAIFDVNSSKGNLIESDNLPLFVRHPFSLILVEFYSNLKPDTCSHCSAIAEYFKDSIDDITFHASHSAEKIRLQEFGIHTSLRLNDQNALNKLETFSRSPDPFLQRAARNSAPLLGRVFDDEELLYHIREQTALGVAVCDFERIHYGDGFLDRSEYKFGSNRASRAFEGVAMTLLGPNDPSRDDIRKAELVTYLLKGGFAFGLNAYSKALAKSVYLRSCETAERTPTDKWLIEIFEKAGIEARG